MVYDIFIVSMINGILGILFSNNNNNDDDYDEDLYFQQSYAQLQEISST